MNLHQILSAEFGVKWTEKERKTEHTIRHNNDKRTIVIHVIHRCNTYNPLTPVHKLYWALQSKNDTFNKTTYKKHCEENANNKSTLVIIHFNIGYFFDMYGFNHDCTDLEQRVGILRQYVRQALNAQYDQYKVTVLELFCDNQIIYDNTEATKVFYNLVMQTNPLNEIEQCAQQLHHRQQLMQYICDAVNEIDGDDDGDNLMFEVEDVEESEDGNIDTNAIMEHVREFNEEYWNEQSNTMYDRICAHNVDVYGDDYDTQMEMLNEYYGPDTMGIVLLKSNITYTDFEAYNKPITQHITHFKHGIQY